MPETHCDTFASFCWVPSSLLDQSVSQLVRVHLSSRGYVDVSVSRLTWFLIGRTDGI